MPCDRKRNYLPLDVVGIFCAHDQKVVDDIQCTSNVFVVVHKCIPVFQLKHHEPNDLLQNPFFVLFFSFGFYQIVLMNLI